METTYTWVEVDGATRIAPRNRGEPVGIAKVGAKALAAAMRRANQKDLDNLRAILEKRPRGSSPRFRR